MFAVVEVNGKQVLVKAKDVIEVNKIKDAAENGEISFDKVLMTFSADGKKVEVGNPYLEGKAVHAKVLTPVMKGEKVVGAKFKRRKRYTKTLGHRQHLTKLEITSIK